MPYRTLQNYLRGEREPNNEGLGKLRNMNIDPAWILTGQGEMFDQKSIQVAINGEFDDYCHGDEFGQRREVLLQQFIDDYNKGAPTIKRIPGVTRVNPSDLGYGTKKQLTPEAKENLVKVLPEENSELSIPLLNIGLIRVITSALDSLELSQKEKDLLGTKMYEYLNKMECKVAPPKAMIKQFANLLQWINNNPG